LVLNLYTYEGDQIHDWLALTFDGTAIPVFTVAVIGWSYNALHGVVGRRKLQRTLLHTIHYTTTLLTLQAHYSLPCIRKSTLATCEF